jgi:hypothetical protein
VVAVPASVLGRIAFDPPLPGALGDALSLVNYGHAAKLFVPLRGPAEPSAVMNVPERYWSWTASGDSPHAQPAVSAFAGSARALERLEVGSGPERWLDSLERLRDDLELDRGGALLSTWTTIPGWAPPTPPRRRLPWPRPWRSPAARSHSPASTPPGLRPG